MKNLYLFRHGQSLWNIEHKIQGQANTPPIPLSPKGEEDAKTIAPHLKNKNIEIIISSDLLRAKQTAEQVANDLGLNIEFDERLRETNFGIAQGYTMKEAEEIFPKYRAMLETEHNIVIPNGESINQVKERMKSILLDVCANRKETNFGISSHGSIISNFISTLNGGTYINLKNAEIHHIIYDEANNAFIYNGVIE